MYVHLVFSFLVLFDSGNPLASPNAFSEEYYVAWTTPLDVALQIQQQRDWSTDFASLWLI